MARLLSEQQGNVHYCGWTGGHPDIISIGSDTVN